LTAGRAAFFFSIGLVVAALVFAPDAPFAEDGAIEELGWIDVRSEPSGLVVLVDGDSVGCTPLDGVAVAPGTHKIGVIPTGRRAFATKPVERRLDVRAGQTSLIELRYPRTVNVTSTPFGASAFLDDRYVGRTPFLFELPDSDEGTLELRLAGHEPVRVAVGLLRTAGAHWSAMLAANPSAPPLNTTRIDRGGWAWWRYGLLVGAGVGAVLGVRLEMEADEAYDSYRSHGNLDRQRELHRRAERYDEYSLASWVAAETFLATAAVLILRDQILGRRTARAEEAR